MISAEHFGLITLHIQEKVAVLILNDPPANVLSTKMVSAIIEEIKSLETTDINALVITGSGNHSFCAGANIKEQELNTPEQNRDYFSHLYKMLDIITDFKYPVIAAINGYCIGAGLELALCSDIRIMSANAILSAAGVNLGLVFCTTRLPRLIGTGKAKEMLFTGRQVNADEAFELGIIEHTVPEREALPKAIDIARVIARKDRDNLAAIKNSINKGINTNLETAKSIEAQHLFKMFFTDNFRERIQFLNRRK